MTESAKTTQTTKKDRQPLAVGVMGFFAALCAAGAAFTAMGAAPQSSAGVGVPSTDDAWNVAELIYAGWMLAGAALFAAIATGLHLLHRIAAALETRRG